MGEMVIVMIIFFILLAFGILFYTQFAHSRHQTTVSAVERANLAEAAKLVSSLPEIHCSYAGDEDLTCIDWQRAQLFADSITEQTDNDERPRYQDLFRDFRLTLVCVYPPPSTPDGPACERLRIAERTVLFDYTDPEFENEQPMYVPVYIYNPSMDPAEVGGRRSGYGWLEITYKTRAFS